MKTSSNRLPVLIGTTRTQEEEKKAFHVPENATRNHMLVTGGTQMGKSYFLELLIRALSKDAAIVVIDPHGSLVEQLLDFFVEHEEFQDRFTYFDINDPDYVVGYNPFLRREGIDTEKQVEVLMDACLRVWGHENYSETPTLDRRLYSLFEILLETADTFVEAMDMVSMERHEKRSLILERAREAGVEDFFLEDWDSLDKMSRRERRDELLSTFNRIRRVVASKHGRLILGQQGDRSIDLLDIINNRKILLVNAAARRRSKALGRLISTLMMN